ncbi:MAG: two-component regulator propeller domain-containing protein [Anaerolineae bacterium]
MRLRTTVITMLAIALLATPGCGSARPTVSATVTSVRPAATAAPATANTAAPAATATKTAAATAAATATAEPVVDVALGEPQSVDEGGYSFAPVPEYELMAAGAMVAMVAPGGDTEVGPVINIMGGATSETTNEELFEQLLAGTTMTVGEPVAVTIGGVPGLAADLSGNNSGEAMVGRVLLAMVTPTQQFAILAAAPEDRWGELEPLVAAVAASVAFYEPAALTPTLAVSSGYYVYSNANVVRDLVVYDGVLYVASLGGVVAWDLASGTATKYTTMDGLGNISAHSIAVCDVPETRIVVGTMTGLSFFDPATGQWDSAPIAPTDSLVATNRIDSIACDAAGGRLLLGYSGVGVLDVASGAFQRFTDKEGLTWNAITDIATFGEDIWVASGYNGVSRITGGEVTAFNEAAGMPSETASAVVVADDGIVWVGTTKGLARFDGSAWRLYGSDTVAGMPADITEMELAADGTLWLASAPFGAGDLCQFDPATETCLSTFEDPGGEPILALALGGDGRPIYGTNSGVYVVEGSSAQRLVLEGEQLATNFVDAFGTDPQSGLLWVGTDGGTQRLDPASPEYAWDTFKTDSAIGSNPAGNWAKVIAVADNGVSWFVMGNGEVSCYQDGQWTIFEDYRNYEALAVDADGLAWIGDDGKGVTVLDRDGNVVRTLGTADGLPSDDVRALLAVDDAVWIGTVNGLALYRGGELSVLFDKDTSGMASKTVLSLAAGKDGSLFVGTMGGLLRYDGSNWASLLERGQQGFNSTITCLAVDPSGRVWAGSADGLFYSDDGAAWTRLTTADGLPTNYITALHADQYGSIWVGGGGSFIGGGIMRIVP